MSLTSQALHESRTDTSSFKVFLPFNNQHSGFSQELRSYQDVLLSDTTFGKSKTTPKIQSIALSVQPLSES